MAEKLQWIADHWSEIGMVVSLVALALTGKWALVRARVAELLVASGEGEISRAFRKKAGAAADNAHPLVRDVIKNLAAKSDPDPEKTPEHKGKRFLKFLGRSALGLILKR